MSQKKQIQVKRNEWVNDKGKASNKNQIGDIDIWKYGDDKTTCQSYTNNSKCRFAISVNNLILSYECVHLVLERGKTQVQRRHCPGCDSHETLWSTCPYVCSHNHLNSARFYATSCSHVREKIEHVRPRSVTSSSTVCQRRITTATRSYNSRVQDLSSNRECLRWERCLRHNSNVFNLWGWRPFNIRNTESCQLR